MAVKILIIDDDKEILFAMSAICEYKGWVAITALDVLDGIEQFKSQKPDVVLIDYHLPIINGIEGVKKLRKLNQTIPIIALTVEEDQTVADNFISAGTSDFALKPIKAPDIVSRINVHLKAKESILSNPTDEYIKGISSKTLEIIERYMKNKDEFCSINEISSDTGLAYKTVHRYLQHLEDEGKVKIDYIYGKIGRPIKKYRLK